MTLHEYQFCSSVQNIDHQQQCSLSANHSGQTKDKVKNELCPWYIKEIFHNNNINRYSFRNSDFIILRFNNVTYGKHRLRYLGPFLWSKLDKNVRNLETLNTFKTQIRKLDLVGMMEDNCKERELWDLAFHSWIENSGLGWDQSLTFRRSDMLLPLPLAFREARIYGILISQDIF